MGVCLHTFLESGEEIYSVVVVVEESRYYDLITQLYVRYVGIIGNTTLMALSLHERRVIFASFLVFRSCPSHR